MEGLREHIDRLCIYEAEPTVNENPDIPRKGRWITGDIHQPLCAACKQRIQHGALAAFARRIDDDDISIDLIFLILPWKYLFSFSDEKLDIFHAI